MTKSELARQLGVSPRTLYNWVRRLVSSHPDLLTWEQYTRYRVLPSSIYRKLLNHFDA